MGLFSSKFVLINNNAILLKSATLFLPFFIIFEIIYAYLVKKDTNRGQRLLCMTANKIGKSDKKAGRCFIKEASACQRSAP